MDYAFFPRIDKIYISIFNFLTRYVIARIFNLICYKLRAYKTILILTTYKPYLSNHNHCKVDLLNYYFYYSQRKFVNFKQLFMYIFIFYFDKNKQDRTEYLNMFTRTLKLWGDCNIINYYSIHNNFFKHYRYISHHNVY